MILHEDAVPDEVARSVHKHHKLEIINLLGASAVVLCDVPVKSHEEGDYSMVDLDESVS